MKLKSLLLGSVAAAGLSTGAFAADLNVLTSLDVCDALGISGLTISSDTNCLQITGSVDYEFSWGDYNGVVGAPGSSIVPFGGGYDIMDNDDDGVLAANNMDWDSSIDAYLKFVGTADSDFGPASATIKFDYDDDFAAVNEALGASSNVLRIEEAYVSVGDSTVIMAGKKGSIFQDGDDSPLNWLGLFNSEGVDEGVGTAVTGTPGNGHQIQIVSDLGNGVSVGAGLENLNGAGNAVGYIAYAGDGISAHASVITTSFLDGTINNWGVHAGFTGTFDQLEFVAAFAADDTSDWNGLISAKGTFDMFTLAASAEAVHDGPTGVNQWGAGISAGATVSDGVTINLGFRWFDEDNAVANNESWQAAAQLVAAVTETVTITGEVGVYSSNKAAWVSSNVVYGEASLAWAPGGDYTSSITGRVNSVGGYKVTYKAAKTFQ